MSDPLEEPIVPNVEPTEEPTFSIEETVPQAEEPIALPEESYEVEKTTVKQEARKLYWRTFWSHIGPWLLPGMVIATIVVLLSFLLILFLTPLSRLAPVSILVDGGAYLGAFCGGEVINAEETITVRAQEVIIYYVSVKRADQLTDVPGTNQSYPGIPYPVGGTFHQVLPWTVPELDPGVYYRSVAARGADGRQKAAMAISRFIIMKKEICYGERCKDSRRNMGDPPGDCGSPDPGQQ